MKKKTGPVEKQKQELSKDLTQITNISKTINDVEQLNEALKKIIEFGEKSLSKYSPLDNAEMFSIIEKGVTEAYDDALRALSKLNNTDKEIFTKFIESLKVSWQGSLSSSKEEVLDKLRKKATDFQGSGNYKKALDNLNQALELAPEDSKNWFERGNVYFDMGNFADAIRDYEVVIKFDPQNSNALCNTGLSLVNTDKFYESLAYFDQALKLDPGQAQSLIGKAESLFRLERFPEALKMANKAIDMYPNNIRANLIMGSILHDGFYNSKKAQNYTQKALDLDKDNIIAKANLAELLIGCKNYEFSSDLAQQVIQSGTIDETFGYPMRLVFLCAQCFLRQSDAAKTAYDLVEYYNAVHDKISIVWKFRGLRRIIKNSRDISSSAKKIILKFIDLAEEPNIYQKKRLLDILTREIRSVDFSAQPQIKQTKIENLPAPTLGSKITIKNTSTPNPTRTGYYNWAIFLSPKKALAEVDHVKYTLHKTFLNNIREVKNRNTGFRLESQGWGEFRVKVEIFPINSDKPLVMYHWLKLRSKISPEKL